MTSGSPGSTYNPHDTTIRRLAEWRRLASIGMPVADIARELGISRATLDRAVCRARKAGHPDAIHHPAAVLPGRGTGHIRCGAARARRARRARLRALETR